MTADGWIQWYFDVKDSFGAPALTYIDSVGRIYAKRCQKCRGKVRHATSAHGWVCGHCGAAWRYWDRCLSKGEIQKSLRPHGFDERHARYFDVARLFYLFINGSKPWDAKLYVLHAMGHPIRRLAEAFPAAYPDAPGPFSRESTRRRVQAARADWERLLSSAGIRVAA